MNRRVNVIGVGMTKFSKPGQSPQYDIMATEAGKLALEDAGLTYKQIEQAYAGYAYGDSTCGQQSLYHLGLTGIPIVNVNNNRSTGSTALYLARQAIEGDLAECVIAMGFEQMSKGALGSMFNDRQPVLGHQLPVMMEAQGFISAPPAAQMFGGAGREYRYEYGTKKETFAQISVKARKHAANNPLAIFNQALTLEEVMASDEVFDPFTRFQCCHPLAVPPLRFSVAMILPKNTT